MKNINVKIILINVTLSLLFSSSLSTAMAMDFSDQLGRYFFPALTERPFTPTLGEKENFDGARNEARVNHARLVDKYNKAQRASQADKENLETAHARAFAKHAHLMEKSDEARKAIQAQAAELIRLLPYPQQSSDYRHGVEALQKWAFDEQLANTDSFLTLKEEALKEIQETLPLFVPQDTCRVIQVNRPLKQLKPLALQKSHTSNAKFILD